MLKKIKLTTITALSLFLFLVLLPSTAGATNATRVNARLGSSRRYFRDGRNTGWHANTAAELGNSWLNDMISTGYIERTLAIYPVGSEPNPGDTYGKAGWMHDRSRSPYLTGGITTKAVRQHILLPGMQTT